MWVNVLKNSDTNVSGALISPKNRGMYLAVIGDLDGGSLYSGRLRITESATYYGPVIKDMNSDSTWLNHTITEPGLYYRKAKPVGDSLEFRSNNVGIGAGTPSWSLYFWGTNEDWCAPSDS